MMTQLEIEARDTLGITNVWEFDARYLGEFDSPGHYVQELFDVADELIEFLDAESAAEQMRKQHRIDWIYDGNTCHVFSV